MIPKFSKNTRAFLENFFGEVEGVDNEARLGCFVVAAAATERDQARE